MESKGEVPYVPRFPTVNGVDVISLRECAALMGPIERGSFDGTYGNLRRLLQLEVQVDAIVALSRFYDSDIRCFLFKNFQMTPTLEEYEQILGFSKSDVAPYQYQKQYYSDEEFAAFLRVNVEKLKLQKQKRNNVLGFPQDYFENLMGIYARDKNWVAFKQLLALTIFGIVLFPQIERHIDTTVIGLFMAFRDQKSPINPVPAILADTYSAFTHHRELKRKKISCSSHMLYAWLLTHAFTNRRQSEELIEYAVTCEVGTMNTQEWIQTLRDLDEHSVRWYMPSCWKDRPEVIVRCGSFQNVPLMGTKGCINYNPSLALRQLGYPMRNAPTEEMLSRFYLFEGSSKDGSLLRRVLQAWKTVVRFGKVELTKKASDITFSQWLQKRIQSVQLPYQKAPLVGKEMVESSILVVEEVGEVKIALLKAEEEKRSLQAELDKLALKNKKLQEESALKSFAIEESREKLKMEEKSKLEAQRYLNGAKEELKRCNLKIRQALEEANQWKNLWEKSKMDEKAAQSSLAQSKRESRLLLAEWENQLKIIKQDRNSVESVLREYQQAFRFEQGRSVELQRNLRCLEESYRQVKVESQYWEHRFVGLLGRIEDEEIIIELRSEIRLWQDKFSKLSELMNQAVASVPKNLRKAEAEMHILNTPPEVYKFVEFCRALITEVKEKTQGASTSNKRKRSGNFKALCI